MKIDDYLYNLYMVYAQDYRRFTTRFRIQIHRPAPPRNMAASTFLAILPDEVKVTRRATDLFDLPDKTPVLAHRHGERRTGGFAMTVGELKAKAAAYSS